MDVLDNTATATATCDMRHAASFKDAHQQPHGYSTYYTYQVNNRPFPLKKPLWPPHAAAHAMVLQAVGITCSAVGGNGRGLRLRFPTGGQ